MQSLPPVLELLRAEIPDQKLELAAVIKLLKDKAFVKEVRDQARLTLDSYPYADNQSTSVSESLVIRSANSINPLSPKGKCCMPNCRVDSANGFARSVGLYADFSVMRDFLAGIFYEADTITADATREVFSCLSVDKSLMPMIAAGVIRLAKPIEDLCVECIGINSRTISRTIADIANELWELLLEDARVSIQVFEKKHYELDVDSQIYEKHGKRIPHTFYIAENIANKLQLEGRPMKLKRLSNTKQTIVRELVVNSLSNHVTATFLEARAAGQQGAVLVSDSKEDTIALKRLDDKKGIPKKLECWETLRQFDLPWISSLTVAEVVSLREKAPKALPRFRTMMRKELFSISKNTKDCDAQAKAVAKRLREEVEELQIEMRIVAAKQGHTFHAGLGLASLGCVVYGVGAHDPTAITAGAALVGALASMHPAEKVVHAEYEAVRSRPAYVLLAARELLKHRK